MDPLIVNFSFGLVFTSASTGLWFLHKEREREISRYHSIERRMLEVEKTFSELKIIERDARKKHSRLANLESFEQKISKAEKELLAIKSESRR
ncbi:TPA: hypothetical protein HA244_01125 [Candidatus Micrarchaeota archaeon]|nr:hypothetical protein [Candidatus Micrarchaeota archaeon]